MLSCGGQSFVLVRPSTDCMRPTQIMESNLLYSKFTNLNIHLIQKHPHRNTQNYIWASIWVSHGPVKWTHNIHHQNNLLTENVLGWQHIHPDFSADFSFEAETDNWSKKDDFVSNKSRNVAKEKCLSPLTQRMQISWHTGIFLPLHVECKNIVPVFLWVLARSI